jgi:hypothetical protein
MIPRPFLCVLALLLVSTGPAAARERRERAEVALPIIVEESAEPADRVYGFREGAMFGGQAARYASAVLLEAAISLPWIAPDVGFGAGELLPELRATSNDFSGPLYCKAQSLPRNRSIMLCLADRDRDGALDQLWIGAAAALVPLVPYPQIELAQPIAPVRFRPADQGPAPAFQIGFYVSGTNPLLGQHHFYPMLGEGGNVGHVVIDRHRAVGMRGLPKAVAIWDAELTIRSYAARNYQAVVTRRYRAGERLIVAPNPTRTVIISVPG